MNEFITWDMIATFTGAVTLTAMIVQLTKNYVPLTTQIYSYIVAVVVLIAATVFAEGTLYHVYDVGQIFLCFVNAIFVALSANGAFTAITKISEGAK